MDLAEGGGLDLRPAERVWPLIHEVIANRNGEDMDALVQIIDDRCNFLTDRPELVRGRTSYHRWPADHRAERES